MRTEVAKNIISSFDKTTFRDFVSDLFASEYCKDSIIKSEKSELVENLYHKNQMYIHYFTFDFFPYSVFHSLKNLKIDTKNIAIQINEIKENQKKKNLRLGDIYFINNLKGFSSEDYYQHIPKQIWALTDEIIDSHQEVGFGNIDTFFYEKAEDTLLFLESYIQDFSGVSIKFTENGYFVNDYYNQNHLRSGILKNDFSLINSVIKVNNKRNIIHQFQNILNQAENERELQDFLSEHFSDVFGNKYDRIVTEVFINFPELDINNKSRRLDIMLRNSLSNDWEIFELKKEMNIVKNYRDVPTFKTVVYDSIQQLKNYSNLLKQDSVKKKLNEKFGIDYFVPEFNLVIGKNTQELSNLQWRNLITSISNDVNIITYDRLFNEMSNRLIEFESYLKK